MVTRSAMLAHCRTLTSACNYTEGEVAVCVLDFKREVKIALFFQHCYIHHLRSSFMLRIDYREYDIYSHYSHYIIVMKYRILIL